MGRADNAWCVGNVFDGAARLCLHPFADRARFVVAVAGTARTQAPLYVIAAVSGSTIGSLFLYWIARTGGEMVLRKFGAESREGVQRA